MRRFLTSARLVARITARLAASLRAAPLVAALALALGPSPNLAVAQDCLWPVWTRVASNPELARYEHAMAYDAARDQVVMFGGRSASNQVLADTLIWNGSAWSPLAVLGPSARAGHAMAYDTLRNRVVLTGGVNAAGASLTDTWEWNGSSWTQVSQTAPISDGPVLAYDAVGHRTLLANHLHQLWSWDGKAWTLVDNGGPVARAAAFDPVRGVLVATEAYRTFEWRPSAGWSQVNVGSFPYNGLIWQCMLYSPVKGGVVMFGGNDTAGFFTNYRGGTFVLGPNGWGTWGSSTLFASPELVRQHHAGVELPGGRALVFGGQTNVTLADTRLLTFEPSSGEGFYTIIPPRITGNPAAIGGNITVWAVLSNASGWTSGIVDLAYHYQWRRDGIPLVDGPGPGATISGANSLTLRLTGVRLSDQGSYDCVVTTCGEGLNLGGPVIYIQCPADLTTTAIPSLPGYGLPDYKLNSDDFFYYLRAFVNGNTAVADLTTTGAVAPGQPGYLVPDGVLSNDDFFVYLALFGSC